MRIRTLNAATSTLALPLIEAQYREHDIPMGGARLRRALRLLLPRAGTARSPGAGTTRSSRAGAILLASDALEATGVAVLSFTVTLEHGGRVAWLDELYVVPGRRGEGIGRALLMAALAAARRSGCKAVELEVVRGHDRAARLYLRESFHRLPRTRFSRAL